MIYVVAELRLKPGTAETAAAEARKVVAGTVKEDGCLAYDFHVSVTDPDRLVAVERWQSREALERHNLMPHLLAWRAVVREIVIDRKIHIISPESVEIK